MNESTIETLAQQIATEELGMNTSENGQWVSDGSDDFWCPEYTDEQSEQIENIEAHLRTTFNETDWQKIAKEEQAQ